MFLPRDAMLARYMLSLSVRLSVRLSQVGDLQRWLNLGSKRLNTGSRKQRHVIAHGH